MQEAGPDNQQRINGPGKLKGSSVRTDDSMTSERTG